MGLIREIQGVNATINKQEKARRERERLSILKENYKKEIESDLRAEFIDIYKKHSSETAYKKAIFEKDLIIEKLYNIISKITHKEGNKKILTYFNFDIIEDLEAYYFKILAKVKKEIDLKENINEKELLERLEKKLVKLFDLTKNKYCASIVASEKEMTDKIIIEVAQNKDELKTLQENYNKILKKVIKKYGGNIKQEKIKIQYKKEEIKMKNNKKIINQFLCGYMLREISKIIPKGFSRGKGR